MSETSAKRQAVFIAAIMGVGIAVGAYLWAYEPAVAQEGHGASAAAEEYERGPNRGRMLRDGDFAIEITIFEDGVPPKFHVYAYQGNKLVDPKAVQLAIDLTRLGGRVDRFAFKPENDYLAGQGTVIEPHSFDVRVAANHGGKAHSWAYASYEGRTTISATAAQAGGLVIETAGPAMLREAVDVTGRVELNRDQVARIEARFPGLVREVRKGVGDTVAAGEVVAMVESNESLQPYSVKSPLAGVVLARSTNIGAVAGTAPLLEVADLSTVWAELYLFPRDAARVAVGQPLSIRLPDGSEIEAAVDRLQPVSDAGSQTVIARVVLNNREGRLRPGQAITGSIVVGSRDVPLAVKTAGLQRFRDFTVVFAQVGETYEVRMLELGQESGDLVEVLGGITAGEKYVGENSFLVKADVDKSGASHDH